MTSGKIEWAAAGEGSRTLLFVHGAYCDRHSWSEQVAAFAKDYRIIVLDLPGHGDSDSPRDGIFSLPGLTEAVESVRSAAKAERVVLVGHSMGTAVVAHYAQRFPQHVAGVVLVDGAIHAPETRMLFKAMAADETVPLESVVRAMFSPSTPRSVQQRVLSMMLNSRQEEQRGVLAVVADPKAPDARVIEAPTLGIYAEAQFLPPPCYDLTHTRAICPHFRSVSLPGTGHFLMMEQPREFNLALGDFVSRYTT